jgi:general nucleoside transport system permease protein
MSAESRSLPFLSSVSDRWQTQIVENIPVPLRRIMSYVIAFLLALVAFSVVLIALGKDPIAAYQQIYQGSLADAYGRSEVIVKMIPFILCALAVAIPAQVGLINVGGEGQIYMGALFASVIALAMPDLPGIILVPLMVVAGCLGGGLWASIAGALKAFIGLNEVICSLLLSYIANLIIEFIIHGPLRDPGGSNWAYSARFSANAALPMLGDTRISLGIAFAIVAALIYFWVLNYTRWGYKLRVIGGNPEAARRSGLQINRYILLTMFIGGAMAGLAGMVEVVAIQDRLRGGISNGYGYIGFLVAWIALQRPFAIVLVAALLGIISVGGDMLQIGVNLPASTVNILMALILFFILRNQGKQTEQKA